MTPQLSLSLSELPHRISLTVLHLPKEHTHPPSSPGVCVMVISFKISGFTDAQTTGKTLFLDAPLWIFLEENSIGIIAERKSFLLNVGGNHLN